MLVFNSFTFIPPFPTLLHSPTPRFERPAHPLLGLPLPFEVLHRLGPPPRPTPPALPLPLPRPPHLSAYSASAHKHWQTLFVSRLAPPADRGHLAQSSACAGATGAGASHHAPHRRNHGFEDGGCAHALDAVVLEGRDRQGVAVKAWECVCVCVCEGGNEEKERRIRMYVMSVQSHC